MRREVAFVSPSAPGEAGDAQVGTRVTVGVKEVGVAQVASPVIFWGVRHWTSEAAHASPWGG